MSFFHDLKIAIRSLARARALWITVAVTLALALSLERTICEHFAELRLPGALPLFVSAVVILASAVIASALPGFTRRRRYARSKSKPAGIHQLIGVFWLVFLTDGKDRSWSLSRVSESQLLRAPTKYKVLRQQVATRTKKDWKVLRPETPADVHRLQTAP
jgi:hypothetical protein